MWSRVWTRILPWWGRMRIPRWLRWAMVWSVNRKFLVGVGAIAFNERGEVLLCRHTYRPRLPWGLPGGWLEHGEDLERAIEREIREETGLTVRALHPLWAGREKRADAVHLIYTARFISGDFRPCAEVSEARFFALDALPNLIPGHRELIQQGYAEWQASPI